MARDQDNAQEVESWKRKYYDSLEQVELKEKEWRRADDLLRRAISRLSLAADGLDKTLDGQLKALRDAIRDRASRTQLESRIEAMSATLVKLDTERSRAREALDATDVLEALLEKTPLPRSLARQQKAFRKQIRNADDAQVPGLIDDFVKLLSGVLADAAAPAEAAGGGLLGRLFNRDKPGAPESADRTKSEPEPAAPASHTPGQRDMLLHLLERLAGREDAVEQFRALRERALRARTESELKRLADDLATCLGAQPLVAAEVLSEPAEAKEGCDIREALVQLLERLSLPVAFEERVETLKERLEDASVPLDSDTVLCDMAELVSDMRISIQREKSELEDFLFQLTGRLQDIDSYVCGAETARRASYENGRELGDKVQAQVQGIASSVQDAQELTQLKSALQVSIDAIIAHVDAHRQVEAARHREAEEEVEKLRQKLSDMEQEAQNLRDQVHEERYQAMTDALTGVPNRLAWEERILQEYARWKRFDTPLSLVVWDVDYFKRVNDEYGHKAGDKVLKVIASILADNVRETDFLARYGGEEFVLLMTGAGVENAMAVVDKLRTAVEGCGFHYKGQQVPITISCGMTQFRAGDSVESAFERADRALYQAKENGRNRCVSADGN